MLFYVLFECKCVLYYCHRVTTQLQLTNIYHISQEHQKLSDNSNRSSSHITSSSRSWKGREAVLPNTMCLHRKEKQRKILNLIFGQAVNYSRISALRWGEGGGRWGFLKSNFREKWWMRVHICQTTRRRIPERHILYVYLLSDRDTSPSTCVLPNLTGVAHTACTITVCVWIFST